MKNFHYGIGILGILCTIVNINLYNDKAFEILNNIHINLNIMAIFMNVIAFVGLLNNIESKKGKLKAILFSIISLYLLYESCKLRETILIYMNVSIYSILTYLKFKTKFNQIDKKIFVSISIIVLAIFTLSIITYQKQRIEVSRGLEYYPNLLQERINESKMFGKSESEADSFLEYCYTNFSNYSFIYLIDNYGKAFGIFLLGVMMLLGVNFIVNYRKIKDIYGKLLSLGIGCFLFIQLGINILQELRIIDVGTVNIPFVTHDDMSIIIYMISISLIMSIYSKKNISAYENTQLNLQ